MLIITDKYTIRFSLLNQKRQLHLKLVLSLFLNVAQRAGRAAPACVSIPVLSLGSKLTAVFVLLLQAVKRLQLNTHVKVKGGGEGAGVDGVALLQGPRFLKSEEIDQRSRVFTLSGDIVLILKLEQNLD